MQKNKERLEENWWNNYVGLTYVNNGRDRDGLDCWGLVRLVHKDIFGNDLPSFSEAQEEDIKEQTIAIQKEGWIKVQTEQAGDVALFSLAGHPIHVGIIIQPSRFLHAFNGTDTCIESLSSAKWKRRLVGIYRYREQCSEQEVTTLPHPLKTLSVNTVIQQGKTLSEIAAKVREENDVPEEFGNDAIIFVNGYVIPKENWDTFVPPEGSKVEYRATVGKGLGSIFKLVVMAAIAIYAPEILKGVNSLFGTTMVAGSFAANATMFAISTISGMLIDAIFPVRPPSMSGQSYDNEQGASTYTVRGGSNRSNPYGTIPVILGKCRFTPPSAITPYYEADGTVSYLRNALCWGYGPLAVDMQTLKIGETLASTFSDIEMAHLSGVVGEDRTRFDELAAQDVEQLNVGVSLDPVTARVRSVIRSTNSITATTRNEHGFTTGLEVILGSTKDNSNVTGTVTSVTDTTIVFSNIGIDETILADTGTAQDSDWYIQGVTWHERSLAEEVTQLKVTLEYPNGLYSLNETSGKKSSLNSKAIIQYKKQTEEWVSEEDAINKLADKSFNIVRESLITYNTDETVLSYIKKCAIYVTDAGVLDIVYGIDLLDPVLPSNSTLVSRLTIDSLNMTITEKINSSVYEFALLDLVSTTTYVPSDFGLGVRIAYTLNVSDVYRLTDKTVSVNITKKMLSGFAVNKVFDVPLGLYDVRVKRLSRIDHDSYDSDRVTFTGITGFSNRKPITFPKPLCMTAVRAKGTNQFNGNVEGFNAEVQSICLDYDYLTNTWIERITSNPASLYRYVLQHPANANPLPDSKIDLEELKTWHNYCRIKGFTFNNIYQSQLSLNEVLRDICAAGRASPARVDGKHTVIVDKPRDYITQHFTPHNSWGFDGSKVLPKIPHGFRVQFNNEQKDYQQDEITVYADGYNESTATLFEGLTLTGVTNPNIVYTQARFHLAQLILRPEQYTLNADIEHLICNRGDLVKVNHDVPMWGIASGRIKTKVSTTELILNEDIPMKAGVSYSIRFRSRDGSSVVRGVLPKDSDGYYDTINLSEAVDAVTCLQDDVFMFGEINQESNDLIVLKIEPSSNLTAKVTLVDYSPEIYDLDDALVIPPFNSKITLPIGLLKKAITEVPIISSVLSDDTALIKTSDGGYQQGILVQFRNPASLPEDVKDIEIQWDWAGDNTTDWYTNSLVSLNSGSYIIPDVDAGDSYVLRARYVDIYGRSGNWTTELTHLVTGRTRPPAVVSAFYTEAESNRLKIIWQASYQPDVTTYEVRLNDSNWGTTDVNQLYIGSNNYCYIIPSIGLSNVYVRTITSGGLYSESSSLEFNYFTPNNISDIIATFHDTSNTTASITLDWVEPAKYFDISGYEISYTHNAALVSKFVNSTTITLPANWIDNRTFTIKTVDVIGNKSTGYSKVLTKLLPNAPTQVSTSVIDNTVMLYWTNAEKTTLPISYVMIRKGDTFETAIDVGPKSGGFTTINELRAGTYTYWLSSVDTDGYESAAVSVSTNVSAPPDFVFHGSFTSILDGTLVNAKLDNNRVVLPVNTTETFSSHFSTRSWIDPQAQVTAGYPVYIQPAYLTGSYTETFDFGTVLASSKVSISYTGTTVSGNPSVVCNVEVSNNGSTWVSHPNTTDLFVTNFRYVRVELLVTGDDKSLYAIDSLTCRADAKQITDSGSLSCLSTDTLGTIFNFNKEFIDVVSLTATANGTTPITAVYDYQDTIFSGTYSVSSNVGTFNITGHGLITGQKVRLSFSTGTATDQVLTISSYTTNSFTANIVTANTSGNCNVYSQSARLYLFDQSGTRVSANSSWTVRGY